MKIGSLVLIGLLLINRMRLPLEVFREIRDVWPENRPISVRISAVDWEEGGDEMAEDVSDEQEDTFQEGDE